MQQRKSPKYVGPRSLFHRKKSFSGTVFHFPDDELGHGGHERGEDDGQSAAGPVFVPLFEEVAGHDDVGVDVVADRDHPKDEKQYDHFGMIDSL